MKRLTVFCGSSNGSNKVFINEAYKLGKKLVENEIELVYGGANVGLMGIVADSVLENKGVAIGVLPHFLKKVEVEYKGLSELILVDSMHERKAKMNQLSDGVITLPGGFGTLEEFFEMLTWAQLGLHKKPIAIYNIDGFYDDLLLFIKSMVTKGFLKQENYDMLIVSDDLDDLFDQIKNYKAPTVGKWINENQI
ncbi:cytokinin riboside 5'-monophosphate phosphoribohydrolase [Empedobacter brevis NBRC 14943 = ATCC 43319]|uniref:Cytokinin riboside 5'-monophosphate phosphoribohydrolase n=1 Tax=Empedobacter brevis NBRC 14943 = ATCC 43319 TaxID=1218108 RepID=A0A511NC18_9FLAO|nr:TIGR00730 family Rossman fold protein [Empedobacter brevis]GEM50333.1 cytokinin riboside 5'-monophosphate phosphoribohydrolase [Empedobacter brevis NBRC 14943 = ATCC 43319]